MSIPQIAANKSVLTIFTTIVALIAGMMAYTGLGQLEDPEFTIKTAAVVTPYPGAAPDEVELEVTDLIERAVQEMPQVKEVESYSRAGLSSVARIPTGGRHCFAHSAKRPWNRPHDCAVRLKEEGTNRRV